MSETVTCPIGEVHSHLVALSADGIAAGLLGDPGIGKSTAARALARAMDPHAPVTNVRGTCCWFVEASGLSPTDVSFPIPQDDRVTVVWSCPEFWPTNERVAAGDFAPRGVLCIEELPAAPPSVQCILQTAILGRRIGRHHLADGWYVMWTGNLTSSGAVAGNVSSALRDRCCVITCTLDYASWRKRSSAAGIDPFVLAFLDSRAGDQSAFAAFDPRKVSPTPRGWSIKVAPYVARQRRKGTDPQTWLVPIAGSVGSGIALDFVGFVRGAMSVDVDAILRDPRKSDIPAQGDKRYLHVVALLARVEADSKAWQPASIYLARMGGEYESLAMAMALSLESGGRVKPGTFSGTPAYTQWALKNTDLISNV